MTEKQKKLVEDYIRLQVKGQLNENWRAKEVYKFEKWAAVQAKKLNMDLDEYIGQFKIALDMAY